MVSGCFPGLVESDFRTGPVQLECCGLSDSPVEVRFLGVGGWLISSPHGQIMTAPLFSNPGMLKAGFGNFSADTLRIQEGLEFTGAGDLGQVGAILVGHGHYDHLMDVPWVAARHATSAQILLTTTSYIQIANQAREMGFEDRLLDVSDRVASTTESGEWIAVGDAFRVLPIYSDHAPHLAGMTLYSGEREAAMPTAPRAANEWLEGESVAWLIDVLDGDGAVGMRIYYQDGVPRFPVGGIPPRDVLGDSIPVDVAIIVPATYAEVDWHPEAILESAQPSHVLLGHWESFFEPVTDSVRPVVFTLLPDFVARLRRATDCNDTCWDLPRPGASFVFQGGSDSNRLPQTNRGPAAPSAGAVSGGR